MREKVEAALEKIRPALRADGGDVELVDVKDGVVTVRLTGACGSLPDVNYDLTHGSGEGNQERCTWNQRTGSSIRKNQS